MEGNENSRKFIGDRILDAYDRGINAIAERGDRYATNIYLGSWVLGGVFVMCLEPGAAAVTAIGGTGIAIGVNSLHNRLVRRRFDY